MQKAFTTLFAFLFLFCSAQKGKIIYQNINVAGKEGITESVYVNWLGKDKFVSLVSNFENNFKRINNGYPNYYREYNVTSPNPKKLSVFLIPKNLVSPINKQKKMYRILNSDKTLLVSYDLKNKTFSKTVPTYMYIHE